MTKDNFNEFQLSDELLRALELLNYDRPTLIQQKVIPEVLKGTNIRVKSRTGSGKTAAFGIPICEKVEWIINNPQALILVPTRELAMQVAEEIASIGRLKRLHVTAIFGKDSIERQELILKQKTHIVVGTPGRIRDLILRKSLQLQEIRFFVIDEADEMFHKGLKEQVEDIIDYLPSQRSTLLFSATLSEEFNQLTDTFMDSPVNLWMDEDILPASQITQVAYVIAEERKLETLRLLITDENPDSCIIFANTQHTVDEIHKFLSDFHVPCQRLHGGLQQKERTKIMTQFKSQEYRYLITTDVSARGIDIIDVPLVINYDMPRGNANYVHRIGRTARMDKYGKAITLTTEKEEIKLKALEEYIQIPIHRESLKIDDITPEQERVFKEKLQIQPVKKEKKDAKLNEHILKLHINAGKKSKIRTNEIVASICSIEGLSDMDIGIITITEIATFVEILNGKGNLVLKELAKKTIKGKLRKVNVARK